MRHQSCCALHEKIANECYALRQREVTIGVQIPDRLARHHPAAKARGHIGNENWCATLEVMGMRQSQGMDLAYGCN